MEPDVSIRAQISSSYTFLQVKVGLAEQRPELKFL
jgi:hypothetical protein